MKRDILTMALITSMLYALMMSWKYYRAEKQLEVYQKGALSLLANKIEEVDSSGQERRMAELGLLDAPHDTPARDSRIARTIP